MAHKHNIRGTHKKLGEAELEKRKRAMRKPMNGCHPSTLLPAALGVSSLPPETDRTRDFLDVSKPSLARSRTPYRKHKREKTA